MKPETMKVSVHREPWGVTAAGENVSLFTVKSESVTVRLTDYGARVVSVNTPDRNGGLANVVLGYDSVDAYEGDAAYLGATVGRYGNRIGKGRFTLDGVEYQIPANNNGNALHGGPVGFDRKVWAASELPGGVEMSLLSPDGDMGFPGDLSVTVRFTLAGSALRIAYSATTSKPTVVNLTNHAYYNLAGEGSGPILGHVLTIPAAFTTPVDAELIPNGQLAAVEGTPFDFRVATAIGVRIDADSQQLKFGGGYDHNFVLESAGPELHLAAHVVEPLSGRTLTVKTTEPAVQFYSGNFLGKSFRHKYGKHDGFPLETQHYPDSPNHANFPSTVLRPGEVLTSETVVTFGVQAAQPVAS